MPALHAAPYASGNPSALSDARRPPAVATLRDALAPDTSLNLPGALDEAALLPCLSVVGVGASNRTVVGPRLPAVAVGLDSLSYGELAVAIHAARIPTSPRALSVDQIQALALVGIARLGLAEIRRINDQSRAANLAYCDKIRYHASAEVTAETQAHHRIWGSWRQEQTATDLAYRLICAMRPGH